MTQRTAKPSRRGRRPAPEDERKDRVIQARVPEDLESTLKKAAETRRMSVSHLIRNILEDTFTLVDNIVADSSALVGQVSRDARRVAASVRGDAEPKPLPKDAVLALVDAWQDVIVNKPGQCIECDIALERGDRAFCGLTSQAGAPAIWMCARCITKL